MGRLSCACLSLLWCAASLAAAVHEDPLEPAKAAIRLKDYEAAIKALQPVVQKNNAEAQYLLGAMYWNGLGVATNEKKASELFERAAKAGNRSAQTLLKQQAQLSEFHPQQALSDAEARRQAFWRAAGQNDVATLQQLDEAATLQSADDFGRTALHRAARAGAVDSIRWLLSRKVRVDAADRFGVTPLMLASGAVKSEAVQTLLGAGANFKLADLAGNTSLMYAARFSRDRQAQALLSAGADVMARNQTGWSAIDFAQQTGANAVVALLRARGATPVRHATNAVSVRTGAVRRATGAAPDLYAGWPDLAVVATRDDPQWLQEVLTHGADPKALTPNGESTLLVAIAHDAPKSAAALLNSGVDSARADEHGMTPLMLAAKSGDVETLKTLLASSRGEKSQAALFAAIEWGQLASVQTLLAANADPNVVDADGATPLILAMQAKQAEAGAMLIKHGATVDATDSKKRTALWYAACDGSVLGVTELIAAHANVNAADKNGMTPLLCAAGRDHVEALDKLLAAGGDSGNKTARGETALMLAAATGAVRAVTRLLAAKPDLDAQSASGDTALIAASRAGQEAVVQLLLQAGASAKLRNVEKAAALDVARDRGFDRIATLLAGR